jgi:hypothetical protein
MDPYLAATVEAGYGPYYVRKWRELEDTLVGIGGAAVVHPPWGDDSLHILLERGVEYDRTHAQWRRGRPSDCHDNARRLVSRGIAVGWATGYALTFSDGLWRQHSWAMRADGRIIETTTRRDMYFGVDGEDARAAYEAAS